MLLKSQCASHGMLATVDIYKAGLSSALPLGWEETKAKRPMEIARRPGMGSVKAAMLGEYKKQIDQFLPRLKLAAALTFLARNLKDWLFSFLLVIPKLIENSLSNG